MQLSDEDGNEHEEFQRIDMEYENTGRNDQKGQKRLRDAHLYVT